MENSAQNFAAFVAGVIFAILAPRQDYGRAFGDPLQKRSEARVVAQRVDGVEFSCKFRL